MAQLDYTFKSDVLFKMLFVRYPHLLKRLVAALLAIPFEDITQFEITNTEMPRHTQLTDKMSLHFYELRKLPGIETVGPENEKDLWLALFNAETEEELGVINKMEVPVMNQAIEAYRDVSATEEFKNLEWMRRKRLWAERYALSTAADRGAALEKEKWQVIVADKEAVIADREAVIADREAVIADKEAEIEQLRMQIDRFHKEAYEKLNE